MNIKPITQKIFSQSPNVLRQIKPSQLIIPTVTIPLVAYSIGEKQDKVATEILNFFFQKNIKVPEFLRPHADTKCGFNAESKTRIKRALQDAYDKGKITEEEHRKYVNKLTFAGHGDAEDSALINDHHDVETDVPTCDDCTTDTDVPEDENIIEAIIDLIGDLF